MTQQQQIAATLRETLTKLGHSSACLRVRPSEEWAEHGSVDFTGCQCIVSRVVAALALLESQAPAGLPSLAVSALRVSLDWARQTNADSVVRLCEAALAGQVPAEQPSPERTPCECPRTEALKKILRWSQEEHTCGTDDGPCLPCNVTTTAFNALSAPCSGVPVSEVLETLKPFAEVPIHPQDGDRWIPRFSTPNTAHFRKVQALYQRLQRGQEGA